MKQLLNLCLLITFLIGYLEWGHDQKLFIFQGEADIFMKALHDPLSVAHPLILIPFIGQLIVLYCVFKREPKRMLNLIGIGCLSTIILVLFLIGLIALNLKMLASTIPFIVTGIFLLRLYWRRSPKS